MSNDFVSWVVEQADNLIKLEEEFPNIKLIKQMYKDFCNRLYICPASIIEINPKDVEEWARKAVAFSNLAWGLYSLNCRAEPV